MVFEEFTSTPTRKCSTAPLESNFPSVSMNYKCSDLVMLCFEICLFSITLSLPFMLASDFIYSILHFPMTVSSLVLCCIASRALNFLIPFHV